MYLQFIAIICLYKLYNMVDKCLTKKYKNVDVIYLFIQGIVELSCHHITYITILIS